MLESEDLIQKVLQISGESLSFDNGTILSIPSFRVDRLYSQEITNYIVEQQEFNFHISTKDSLDLELKVDDICTLQNNSFIFTFKLDDKPIPYLDGWSRIPVNLISRETL